MNKTLCLLIFCAAIHAQESTQEPKPAPPGSEVLLFAINTASSGQINLSSRVNVSNSPGYDSQPRFSKDGESIYYTHFEKGQMDVFQYNLNNKSTQAYLTTAESEYSPTPMPQQDGLSVVQVDAKGDQYLVVLNKALPKTQQSQKYSELKQIGYFNWTQANSLWTFVLNEQQGGDLYLQGEDRKAVKITKNIGRSFITDAQAENLYFVDKKTQPWSIQVINSETKTPQYVMDLPTGVEDFTLDSKGRFWAGRDNTLFISDDHQRWYIAQEFHDPKYHQITRVTTNPEASQIAIVFAEKQITE